MTGRPVLESMYPGKNTLIFPCPLIPCTAARIFTLNTLELKVLVLVSSFSCVVLAGQNWLSATVSEAEGGALPDLPQIEEPSDPAVNLVSHAAPWGRLQDHPHEDHGALHIPSSISRPPEFLCKILDKPPSHCTLRSAVPRARLDDKEPPPHLPDITVLDAPVHVATIVLTNLVAIHLDEAEVRLGQDNPFQVCPLLS